MGMAPLRGPFNIWPSPGADRYRLSRPHDATEERGRTAGFWRAITPRIRVQVPPVRTPSPMLRLLSPT
jgi:hypothetical protein